MWASRPTFVELALFYFYEIALFAEKIFKASEAVELDADEVAMIRNITPTLPGKFADSINDHFKDMEEKYD